MTFKLITNSDRTEFLFDCVASLFSMKFHTDLNHLIELDYGHSVCKE